MPITPTPEEAAIEGGAPASPFSWSGVSAAIGCITLAGIGLSLSVPLLAFAMEARGASGALIGLNTAMGGVAVMALAPFTPRAAAAIGVRALLFFGLALGAASMVGFALVEPLWAWFPLRFAFGAALAILFVLSEFWINALAPPASRGFVMGVYATALSIGFAAGPVILLATGMTGLAPYAACAALFAVAALPIALAGGEAPALSRPEPGRGSLFFILVAPIATLAGFTFGAIETGAFTFLPLYAARIGVEASVAALIGSVIAIGNVASQIPLGLVSDRMDRRLLLLIVAGTCALGAAAIPLVASSPLALYGLLAVWGGLVSGLYTVGLAHLGARFTGVDLATANAAFVIMYSLGMLVGPPLLGFSFDLWNPHGAPLALALMLALYAGVVAVRMKREP